MCREKANLKKKKKNKTPTLFQCPFWSLVYFRSQPFMIPLPFPGNWALRKHHKWWKGLGSSSVSLPSVHYGYQWKWHLLQHHWPPRWRLRKPYFHQRRSHSHLRYLAFGGHKAMQVKGQRTQWTHRSHNHHVSAAIATLQWWDMGPLCFLIIWVHMCRVWGHFGSSSSTPNNGQSTKSRKSVSQKPTNICDFTTSLSNLLSSSRWHPVLANV